MTRPVLSPSLLARQTPEVRAILTKTPRPKRDAELAPVRSLRIVEGSHVTLVLEGLALRLTQNSRCHWARKAKVVKHQRRAVAAALKGQMSPPRYATVTITRVGPVRMDDDNVTASTKGVRDEVAAWLGYDDRDPRVTWIAQQERGPYAVRIGIAPRAQGETT